MMARTCRSIDGGAQAATRRFRRVGEVGDFLQSQQVLAGERLAHL